jgi:hypothetical protein
MSRLNIVFISDNIQIVTIKGICGDKINLSGLLRTYRINCKLLYGSSGYIGEDSYSVFELTSSIAYSKKDFNEIKSAIEKRIKEV